MPNNDDLSPEQGWVSIQELHNVRMEYMRKMDNEVFLNRDMNSWTRAEWQRASKLLDTAFMEAMRRCKRNWREFLAIEPHRARPSQAPLPGVDSRESFEKHKAEIRSKR